MNVNNVVRIIAIRGTSEGMDKVEGDLKRVAQGYENVAVVSESSARRVISVENAYRKQTLALDEVARNLARATSATKVADDARRQELISLQQYGDRLNLITQKYGVATEAAQKFARSQSLSNVNAAPAVNQRVGVQDDFGGARRAEDIAAYGQELDRLRAKFDPLFAAGMKYKAVVEEISRAESVGAISAQTATSARLKETASYEDQISKLNNLAAAQKAAAQAAVNKQTIVPDRGADIAAYGKQLDDIRAKFNPLFAAGRQYKDTLTEINTAAKSGAISEKERVAALTDTKVAFVQQVNAIRGVNDALPSLSAATAKATEEGRKFAGQTGLNRYEMLNFSRQVQDVVVSLAGGQSPFVVLTQQGSQFLDIAQQTNGTMRGFWGQIVTGARSILTPVRSAAVAIGSVAISGATAANSWINTQADVERQLSGTGRAVQLQAADINKLAEQTSSWGTISQKEARASAAAFANAGVTTRENLAAANRVALDFAKTIGVDLDEGVKILAKDLTSGMAGVDDLGKRLGGLTGAQRDYLATLDASTDKTKLQAAALQFVAENTRQAAELMTPLGRLGLTAANALSNVWDDYGSVADGGTATEAINKQIAALEKARETASKGGFDPRVGSTGNAATDVAKLTDQIGMLRLEATKLEAAGITVKFAEWGKAALEAAEEFAPLEKQVDALQKRLKLLKEAQGNENLRLTLTPSQNETVDRGTRAVEVKGLITKDEADQADRYNQTILEIAASYQGVGVSTALVLRNLETQLSVAEAVGQMAQIEAQHRARVVELSQKLSETEATRIADLERVNALAQIEAAHKQQMVALQGQLSVAEQVTGIGQINAQYQATVALLTLQIGQTKAIEQAEMGRQIALAGINAQADRTLRNLQEQGQLIRAASEEERGRIQAAQEYQRLIDKGVDSQRAGAIAAQMQANARSSQDARDEAQAEQDAARATQERASAMQVTAAAAERYAEAAAAAAAEFERIRELTKFLPSGIPLSQLFQTKDGSYSQFDPKGYTSDTTEFQIFNQAARGAFGAGGYTMDRSSPGSAGIPNAQGLERVANGILSMTGSLTDTFDQLLVRLNDPRAGVADATGQLLDRVTNLLPDDESKIQAMWKQVQALNEQPQTLARDERIQRLLESMKALTDATKENTDAINAQLDPLMSQGHDYLNSLKLGYYHAATGLSGVVQGSGGVDSTPVHMMLTPGEHVQVTPAGQMPRAANSNTQSTDNSKVIHQTNHITIKGADTPQSRLRAKQTAQGFISAAARAVA